MNLTAWEEAELHVKLHILTSSKQKSNAFQDTRFVLTERQTFKGYKNDSVGKNTSRVIMRT